ncbi:hypothetical protein [Shewanella marina]|uniref:hypothetical protein n=1 Tax=Shewanella marina TaxID=487319 RepID=UPI000AF7B63A
MAIRNLKDDSDKPWLCECYPTGRSGKRIRKWFATRGEAQAFENFTMRIVENKPGWAKETIPVIYLSYVSVGMNYMAANLMMVAVESANCS